jgi:glycosyltransferase involved in cell wall biosynthesis
MLRKAPSVSVIIPAYNQAQFLDGAIKSALSQTYQDFEIIVVDDGSTDLTPQVARQFGNNIRYIRQDNQGLGGARNTGIRAAEGEFIGLLDADDEWMPPFLDKEMDKMKCTSNAAAVYCYAQGIDSEGRVLPQIFGGPAVSSEKVYHTILRANFLIPSTILIKRSVVISVGLFEQNNKLIHGCEDWDLWLRILRNNPEFIFIGIPECLVSYRLHNNSLSNNEQKMQAAVHEVIKKHFGPDDGPVKNWSIEKRMAYGGVYRYHLIASIQRSINWQAGPVLLSKALRADLSLAGDLSLFYDLALGSQPVGFRGTNEYLDIEKNAKHIVIVLDKVFTYSTDLKKVRRKTYGTANYALGLVAYNTGKFNLCRKYLIKCLSYRPDLIFDSRLVGDLAKSYIPPHIMNRIKKGKVTRFTYSTKKNNNSNA